MVQVKVLAIVGRRLQCAADRRREKLSEFSSNSSSPVSSDLLGSLRLFSLVDRERDSATHYFSNMMKLFVLCFALASVGQSAPRDESKFSPDLSISLIVYPA